MLEDSMDPAIWQRSVMNFDDILMKCRHCGMRRPASESPKLRDQDDRIIDGIAGSIACRIVFDIGGYYRGHQVPNELTRSAGRVRITATVC